MNRFALLALAVAVAVGMLLPIGVAANPLPAPTTAPAVATAAPSPALADTAADTPLATNTPPPTNAPSPTATPLPTDTPSPPSNTATNAPTATAPLPTDTPPLATGTPTETATTAPLSPTATSTPWPIGTATATPTATEPPTTTATTSPTSTATPPLTETATATTTPTETMTVTATTTATATTTVTATVTPTPTLASAVVFDRLLAGDRVGQHKAPPQTRVTITIAATPDGAAPLATLVDYFPSAWGLADADSGAVSSVDATMNKIEWTVGDLRPGETVTRTYTLNSPPLTSPPTDYSFWSTLSFAGGMISAELWPVIVADPASSQYLHAQDLVVGSTTYNTVNTAALSGTQATASVSIATKGYFVFKDAAGISIFASDAVPAGYYWDISGTWTFDAYVRASTTGATAYARAILYRISPWGTAHYLTMSPQSTANAVASTTYTKITWTLAVPAGWTIGPGERFGVEFLLNITAARSGATATLGFDTTASPSDVIAQVTQNASPTPTATATLLPPAHADNAPWSPTADGCARCHRTHSAQAPTLGWVEAGPPYTQESVCFSCHDGTGAPQNIQAQFSKTYQHPITGNDVHRFGENTSGQFSGANRHVECTDCHNPHYANAAAHTQGSSALSGLLQVVSGVNLTFGGAGTTPSYSFTVSADQEAKICVKCHSSWAYGGSPPPAPSGFTETDQSVEFNPDNLAVHPVFGKGLNQSPNWPDSTFYSPWNKQSTVVCSDCHGSETVGDPKGVHGSNNKWLLKSANPPGAGIAAEEHVVCFLCHRYDVYYSGAVSGSRVTHPINNGMRDNTRNAYGIWCLNCHGGDPQGAIHGTNRGIGTSGTDKLGEHFMNGAAIAGFSGLPDDRGNITCWTKSSTDQFNLNCTQHSGGQTTTPNYNY